MGLRLAPPPQLYPRVRQRFSYLPFLASILLPLESDSLYFYQLQPPFLFRRVPYLDQIVRVILAYCLSLYYFLLIIRPLDFVIRIKKVSSPKIKIWFGPMFFSGFFCGFERCGSAAFPNFRGGIFSEKCVRTNSRILHHIGKVKEFWFFNFALRSRPLRVFFIFCGGKKFF